MNRRDFSRSVAITGALASRSAIAQRGGGKRPNLLFVFSDQHAYDLLDGHAQVKTPSLDAFSRQGLNLDSCFSISPLCNADARFVAERVVSAT